MIILLKILALIVSVLTIIAGLDLTGLTSIIPEDYHAAIGITVALSGLLVRPIIDFGDLIDDGLDNESFPPKKK